MRWLNLLFKGIVLALCVSVCSYAQDVMADNCEEIEIRVDQRPGTVGQPTEVAVGLRVVDVTGIEDTTQTVAIDFIVSKEWTDHRLDSFEGCKFEPDEIWTPQIDITNSGRLFTRLKESVDVLSNGRLRQIQRYSGTLAFSYDAHLFPFDEQDIVIMLLSEEYDQTEIMLTVDEAVTGRNTDTFNIADWKIFDVNAQIVVRPIQVYRSNHSAYEFHLLAERRSGYFVWKVILPLLLIVFMSWTVFWINPSQVGTQISMSATSMLTLIAFQFAMGHLLPRLSYFTVMDKFVTGSTILVFLSLIESIVTNYLVTSSREELALKLDRYCCCIFPSIYILFVLAVFSFKI